MSQSIIGFAICAAVAVGTALYFVFCDKKKERMHSTSSRSSQSRPQSEPMQTYVARRNHQSSPSRYSHGSTNQHRSGENYTQSRRLESRTRPIPRENPSHGSSNSSLTCRVCEEPPNAKFLPCGHLVFCYEHASVYFHLTEERGMGSDARKCPIENCHCVIDEIV